MTTPWEEGSQDAKIVLIGEAPARYEIRAGRPFVGPAGYILEEALHSARLVRRDCYITNVFMEEIRKDKEGKTFYSTKSGNVLWTDKYGFTDEGMEQVKALYERLSKCSANVIMPLGRTALAAVHQELSVMKWRGSILLADQIGRKIVPSVHPAAILRGQPNWKYLLIHDLKRVNEEAEYADLRLPKRDILLNPTFQEVEEFLIAANRQKEIATDIEVYNYQVSCFSVAVSPTLILSVPLFNGHKDTYSEEDELNIWKLYADILSNEKVKKIGQNLSFDSWFLYHQNGIFMKGPISDTMIAQSIMYPDFPKGLDFICSIRTREPYYKDDRKLWSRISDDPDTFWIYNAKDSAVAMEAWYPLEEEMLAGGYIDNYNFTVSMINPLTFMMSKGALVDRDKLAETRIKVSRLIDEKTLELNSVAKKEFNPGSPKQCQEYFYGTLGLRPYLNHKTGRPTTDDIALSRIIRKYNVPEARLVQEIRTLNKLSDSSLSVEIDKDGRLRCSYNIRGTWTGRLSSGETIFGTGMNMQNIDARFREFLIPDPDME